jgi:hypothetical protein
VKNVLLVNALLTILFLSDTYGGRTHDKHIADATPGIGHMKVDTFGKKFFHTLHIAFKANRISAEAPRSSKESCLGNMAIRLL